MEANMTRRTWLLAAVLSLSACGGGGALTPDRDAVVTVEYGDTASYSGLTYMDDGPTRIVLARWLENFGNPAYVQHTLRHEIWHAVTRIKTHSLDVTCVSCDNRSPYDGVIDKPCAVERDQMRASDPIRLRWVGHVDEALEAAEWWNLNILASVVEVVE